MYVTKQIELKRAEFRHYLEKSGVMDALSRALIKLYDEPNKPDNPVAFVRQNFIGTEAGESRGSCVNDRVISDQAETSDQESSANALVHSLREELTAARQEIRILQQALDDMQTST